MFISPFCHPPNFLPSLSSQQIQITPFMLIKHSDTPNYDQFGAEPSYQIDTCKVIKGHKLTMKELQQRLRIKSKNSSPTSKQNRDYYPPFQSPTPKITDFSEKYKGLETLDDEESLYRFITYQREKQSRESARGIKLFSCQKKLESMEDQGGYINSHISFTPRNAKTSQSHRRNHSSINNSHNKTISYDNQQTPQTHITFASDNLGKRMNEYLNIILQKKEKAEISIQEDEIKEQAELYKLKNELIHQARTVSKQAKAKTTTFYRQMKKNKKNRILSAQTIASDSVKSNELVKSLMRKTAGQFQQKTTLACEKLFTKSCSEKVRENQTSRSFYSKQHPGRETFASDFDNVLTLIYKK